MQTISNHTPYIALPTLNTIRTDKNEWFMLSEPMSRPARLRPLRLSVKKSRIAGSVRRKARAKRLLFERVSILLFSWASTAGSFLLLLFFGDTKKSKSLCKAPGYSLRQGHRFNAGPTLAGFTVKKFKEPKRTIPERSLKKGLTSTYYKKQLHSCMPTCYEMLILKCG